MNNLIPLEYEEQCTVVSWCQWMKIPIVAIPNSNSMSGFDRKIASIMMVKLKASGLSPGFPDLMVPMVNKHYSALFIEMKRAVGGVVSDTQKYWNTYLNKQGYQAFICYGADEAIKVIDDYVSAK